MNEFMIGQRVLYYNVICTICKPEVQDLYEYWVSNPEKGYSHGVATDNLKPLPGGQL